MQDLAEPSWRLWKSCRGSVTPFIGTIKIDYWQVTV